MKYLRIFGIIFTAVIFLVSPKISNAQTLPLGTSSISGAYFDGTDDQAFSLTSRTVGVAEQVARVDLDLIGPPPNPGDTITIGSCVFNFVDVSGVTENELDCADDEISVDLTSGFEDSSVLLTDVFTQIVNISDDSQGLLTIDDSNLEEGLFFIGTSPISVTTAINVSGLPGKISLVSSPATFGVLQQETYELTGTLDAGDQYLVSGDYFNTNIIVTSESDFAELANTIVSDIINEQSVDYVEELYTVATSTSSIIFTAKAASDDQFIVFYEAINAVASPQRTVFFIIDSIDGVTYVININGTDYEFTANASSTRDDIADGLDLALDSSLDVTCNRNPGSSIVCAGPVSTPFSYSIDAYGFPDEGEEGDGEGSPDPEPEEGSRSGGSSGTKTNKMLKAFINNISESITSLNLLTVDEEQLSELQKTISLIIKLAEKEKIEVPAELKSFLQKKVGSLIRDLELEDDGNDVARLQKILIDVNQGSAATKLRELGATGYFGPLTQAALAEWQAANGVIPATGYFGPITRAKMKTLALAGIWW